MRIIRRTSDEDLLDRIKAGDRSVLGDLFARYERLVCSYIKSRGGNNEDAEDMLQDAIIVLWQNVCSGEFKLTSKIGTYLVAVAKNKWRSELRKRRRISDSELSEEFADGESSPLDALEDAEATRILRYGLNKIDSGCKNLLVLFYFDGRNMDEIAGIMGFASADVAKSKKYQCKKALQAVLNQITAERERMT